MPDDGKHHVLDDAIAFGIQHFDPPDIEMIMSGLTVKSFHQRGQTPMYATLSVE